MLGLRYVRTISFLTIFLVTAEGVKQSLRSRRKINAVKKVEMDDVGSQNRRLKEKNNMAKHKTSSPAPEPAFYAQSTPTTAISGNGVVSYGFEANTLPPTRRFLPPTFQPVIPPTFQPVAPATSPPVEPPTYQPVAPPTFLPMTPPTSPPMLPPTFQPVAQWTLPPVAPPTFQPVTQWTLPPLSPPTPQPVSTLQPLVPWTSPPVEPPTLQPVEQLTSPPVEPPTLQPVEQLTLPPATSTLQPLSFAPVAPPTTPLVASSTPPPSSSPLGLAIMAVPTPSQAPTPYESDAPSGTPSSPPSPAPSSSPSSSPSLTPTHAPSPVPSSYPSDSPSYTPTIAPTTQTPTISNAPSAATYSISYLQMDDPARTPATFEQYECLASPPATYSAPRDQRVSFDYILYQRPFTYIDQSIDAIEASLTEMIVAWDLPCDYNVTGDFDFQLYGVSPIPRDAPSQVYCPPQYIREGSECYMISASFTLSVIDQIKEDPSVENRDTFSQIIQMCGPTISDAFNSDVFTTIPQGENIEATAFRAFLSPQVTDGTNQPSSTNEDASDLGYEAPETPEEPGEPQTVPAELPGAREGPPPGRAQSSAQDPVQVPVPQAETAPQPLEQEPETESEIFAGGVTGIEGEGSVFGIQGGEVLRATDDTMPGFIIPCAAAGGGILMIAIIGYLFRRRGTETAALLDEIEVQDNLSETPDDGPVELVLEGKKVTLAGVYDDDASDYDDTLLSEMGIKFHDSRTCIDPNCIICNVRYPHPQFLSPEEDVTGPEFVSADDEDSIVRANPRWVHGRKKPTISDTIKL